MAEARPRMLKGPYLQDLAPTAVTVMWQLAIPVRIKPMLFSKLNTALQLLLVGVVLLLEGFGLRAPWLRALLIWTVAATTLGSGARRACLTVATWSMLTLSFAAIKPQRSEASG